MSTNTIGVHALVWTGEVDADSLTDAAHRSKEAGYSLLELSLHRIEDMDLPATRAAFDAAEIAVACSRGLTPDADVSSEDSPTVARGEELLRTSVETTAALGGTLFTGALYSAFGKAAGPLTATGRRNAVGALKRLAPYAADLGVTLGLEVCNRYETNVANTAYDALNLVDDIGEDNIMIHLDSYHMNIEEKNLVDPILDVGERLGYVHIGENNRGMLGAGSLDFSSLFWALERIEYRGAITFESFSSAVVSDKLSNDLAIWRSLWDDSDLLARQAHSFVTGYLEAAAGAGA